jgi:hypothetical protein
MRFSRAFAVIACRDAAWRILLWCRLILRYKLQMMPRQIQVPVAKDRFVILHYHIFKNAGSTIDYALSRNFGEGFIEFHGVHDDAALSADDIHPLVTSDLSIRAITSHHLRYPKPVMRGVHFIDVCFIRHPLDRIRSLYHYGRKQDPDTWLGGLAQQYDEAGFIAHLVEHAPHAVNDVQVNFLVSGGFYARPPGAADRDEACATVERVCALGVVDLFDVSMVAIERYLRPMFPFLSMEYVRQNVSAPEPHMVESGSEAIATACRQAWGDALYAKVFALNEQDLRLYAKAREEVMRRFALVPDRHERLNEFRERCSRLAEAEALQLEAQPGSESMALESTALESTAVEGGPDESLLDESRPDEIRPDASEAAGLASDIGDVDTPTTADP